jgi:hypothetical protein
LIDCKNINTQIRYKAKQFKNEYKNNKGFFDNQFKFVNYKKPNNTKLAYYTCFFGGENNYSFLKIKDLYFLFSSFAKEVPWKTCNSNNLIVILS